MVDIAAMHHRVDDQLTNGFGRDLVHVLPVHAFEPRAHMDVAQHVLVRRFYKLLRSAREFAAVYEHGLRGTFEHATLHH